MNKGLILALVLLFSCCISSQAQKTTKSKKKATVRKVTKKKPAPIVTEVVAAEDGGSLMMMDGDKYLYSGKAGDQLVYEVNANGNVYDFIVTLQPESDQYRYSFDWEMTAPVNKKGHVNVSKEAASDSKRYKNYFGGGDLTLTDACTVWMTYANFGELPDKQTTMQMDDGEPTTFYRKDEAETEYEVLYKGRKVKLDVFKMDNDKKGGQRQQLWIQNISSNSLIVKMDLGWTIRLKEIR